jgi:hypothetical protein
VPEGTGKTHPKRLALVGFPPVWQMIKDITADHFFNNPQAGCRVTYPIGRFYVQVDSICKLADLSY